MLLIDVYNERNARRIDILLCLIDFSINFKVIFLARLVELAQEA